LIASPVAAAVSGRAYRGAKELPRTTNLCACSESPVSDVLTPSDYKKTDHSWLFYSDAISKTVPPYLRRFVKKNTTLTKPGTGLLQKCLVRRC